MKNDEETNIYRIGMIEKLREELNEARKLLIQKQKTIDLQKEYVEERAEQAISFRAFVTELRSGLVDIRIELMDVHKSKSVIANNCFSIAGTLLEKSFDILKSI